MDPKNWPRRRRACPARSEPRSYTIVTGAAGRRHRVGEPRAAYLMGAGLAPASAYPRVLLPRPQEPPASHQGGDITNR